MNRFLAGVGTAMLIRGNELIGVARTLTESTFSFAITAEDIRGGAANALWGRYFHDSALNVTLTDSMFSMEYIAASLGTTIQNGGLSIKQEELEVTGGVVTVSETPIATCGTYIGWYKLPTEDSWTVSTFAGKNLSIPDAVTGARYCVRYFYNNINSRSFVIKSQYVPAELHVVIINDLFNGDVGNCDANTNKIGRLITDIPRLQLDGNQNLSLTASGAATTSLSGSALAVSSADCEDDSYYGTMTEEIFGETWQDRVLALAVADSGIELDVGETQTLSVYAVFGSNASSLKIDNSNLTFSIASGTSATVTSAGVVTGVSAGDTLIEISLNNYPNVAPAYALVVVS